MGSGGELHSFLRRLPVTLVLALVLWLVARPALERGMCGLAQVLIRAFEYPRVTRLVVGGHRAEVHRSDLRPGSQVPAMPLTEKHFNTIVLLALFLALPRPVSRRQLERLFMAWVILLVTQALNLVFHVKFLYATALGEWSLRAYTDFARNLYGFCRHFTDLPGRFSFPFVLWLGFNWDHVMRIVGVKPQEPEGQSRKRRKVGSRRS